MTDISIGNNDNIDIIAAMKLHILVCDGVFDLGLAALTDVGADGKLTHPAD